MSIFLKEIVMVGSGGAIGSILRLLISREVQMSIHHKGFPLGILIVNITGCFIMGVLYSLLFNRYGLGPLWRAFILIGILGGYTTFSSFSLDTLVLIQEGNLLSAFGNILFSVIGCLTATFVGMYSLRFF